MGGNSVFLGSGNANFNQFFKGLETYHYKGPFIMQAYRDEEGLKIFKRQLDWIIIYLDQLK